MTAVSGWQERDITGQAPEKRPLNLMFQSYALFPHMTVRQNLAYGLEMERLPRKPRSRARVEEMLKTDGPARRSPTASRPSFPAGRSSAWRSPAR